jgi:hypothetical protein
MVVFKVQKRFLCLLSTFQFVLRSPFLFSKAVLGSHLCGKNRLISLLEESIVLRLSGQFLELADPEFRLL